MRIEIISKDRTILLKGLAILLILSHNFLHWTDPINMCENEFGFSRNNIIAVKDALFSQPSEIINIFLSYLGHFGVQVFILLSGYGLTRMFLKKENKWGSFMLDRLKKLYPLLITGIIFFFFAKILHNYKFIDVNNLKSIGYKLLFINNFIPNEGESLVGPWWFFGLIMQLYIFFPLFFKLTMKFGIKAFAGISIVSYAFIYLFSYMKLLPDNVFILHQAIGHFPEFVLGIYLATGEKKTNKMLFPLALTVFCLGNYYKIFFPLTFLCVAYMFVCVSQFFFNNHRYIGFVKPVLTTFGKYSMVLFVTHGFYRWQFVAMAKDVGNAGFTLLMLFLFLINALIVALAADVVYKYLLKLVDRMSVKKKELIP